MAKNPAFPPQPAKQLVGLLNDLGHRHPIERVFRDWVEMSAIAISNTVDRAQFAAREARYMALVPQYTPDELAIFPKMLGLLVQELEITRGCAFEGIIADLEIGGRRSRMGQYFTPGHVCELLAKMTFTKDQIDRQVAEKGFITVMEPCCGAGGMTIAAAHALEDLGFNFQTQMHVTAIDIDPMCVHLTYLQTSLLGIPAVIIQGDTINGTAIAQWFTPFHILRGWAARLRVRDTVAPEPAPAEPIPAMDPSPPEADPLPAEIVDVQLPAVPQHSPALVQAAANLVRRVRIAPGSTPPFA